MTIVNGVYKPSYNWGAPPCRDITWGPVATKNGAIRRFHRPRRPSLRGPKGELHMMGTGRTGHVLHVRNRGAMTVFCSDYSQAIQTYWCVLRREWVGCWGLLGLLLLGIMDHSRNFPAFSTSKQMYPTVWCWWICHNSKCIIQFSWRYPQEGPPQL